MQDKWSQHLHRKMARQRQKANDGETASTTTTQWIPHSAFRPRSHRVRIYTSENPTVGSPHPSTTGHTPLCLAAHTQRDEEEEAALQHTSCNTTHREYQLRKKERGKHSDIRKRLCTQFGEWKKGTTGCWTALKSSLSYNSAAKFKVIAGFLKVVAPKL